MTLKSQLRLYLDVKGMTAASLAKKSGVPKQSLSGWLAGSNPRDIRQIKRVADVLGTTVDHLMFGKGLESHKAVELDTLLDDKWVSGIFEIQMRRVKKAVA